MKVWETLHNGLIYRFEYFEITDEVTVLKRNKPTYTILLNRQVQTWYCNCPGSVYHGHCWHEDSLSLVLSRPDIIEPWAKWAEEASQMRQEAR